MHTIAKPARFALACSLFASLTAAEPGTLDPYFGNDGIMTLYPSWFPHPVRVPGFVGHGDVGGNDQFVTDSRGRRIFNCRLEEYPGAVNHIVVRREMPDGSPDTTFDGDGMAVLPAINPRININIGGPIEGELINQLTVDSQDRIVFVTNTTVGRLTKDGHLDPTFGTGGILQLDPLISALLDVTAVTTDSQNRVIIGGSVEAFTGKIFIARYDSSGTTRDFLYKRVLSTEGQFVIRLRTLQIAADGKILYSGTGDGCDYCGRLTAAGGNDASWDGDGVYKIDTTRGFNTSDTSNGYAPLLRLQSGQYLFAASITTEYLNGSGLKPYTALTRFVRFNASGSIDTTFGTSGFIEQQYPWHLPDSLRELPDGGIRMRVWRDPDNSLPERGEAVVDASMTFNTTLGFMPQPAAPFIDVPWPGASEVSNLSRSGQRFFLHGSSSYNPTESNSPRRCFSICFGPDGLPIQSYGRNGAAEWTQPSGYTCQPLSDKPAHLPDGSHIIPVYRYAMAWPTPTNALPASLLVRFTSAGVPDLTWASDGALRVTPNTDSLICLARQADGKLLAAGTTNINKTNGLNLLRRFNADGSPDSSFGSGVDGPGRVVYDHQTSLSNSKQCDQFNSLVILGSGRILAAGYGNRKLAATASINDITGLVRVFEANGSAAPVLTNGTWTSQNDLNSSLPVAAAVLPDGGALVLFRYSNNTGASAAVVRFAADGSLATGFGTNGVATVRFSTVAAETFNLYGFDLSADGTRIIISGSVNNYSVTPYSELPSLAAATVSATGLVADAGFGTAGLASYPPQRINKFMTGPLITDSHAYGAGVNGRDALIFRTTIGSVAAQPPTITEGATISVTMSEDGNPTPFNLTLHALDGDSPILTWSSIGNPLYGRISLTPSADGGQVAVGYQPDADFVGQDTFRLIVSDGLQTDTILITVTVESQPDPEVPSPPEIALSFAGNPVANNGSITGPTLSLGGNQASMTIRITNAGTGNLVISGTSVSAVNGVVVMPASPVTSIAPGNFFDWSFTLSGTAAGIYSFNAGIISNDSDESQSVVQVTGTVSTQPSVSAIRMTHGSEAGPLPVTIRFSRCTVTASALPITVAWSGTATSGSDYTNPGSIAIPANQPWIDVPVAVLDDADVEGAETLITTIQSGAGYIVAGANAAQAVIDDNDDQTKGPGDLNGDKVVNINDLVLVTANFGKSSGFPPEADGNGDGVVNISDLLLVTANYGKAYP